MECLPATKVFYSPISFATTSYHVAQTGLECIMLLSQPPKCWNSNCVLTLLPLKAFFYYYTVLRIYARVSLRLSRCFTTQLPNNSFNKIVETF